MREHGGYGRPSLCQVAAQCGLTAKEVAQALAYDQRVFSLDEPVRISVESLPISAPFDVDAPTTDLASVLWDACEPDVQDLAVDAVVLQSAAAILTTLPRREAAVLNLRHGIDDGKPKTLDEIGRVFGVTRERIRQIEKSALEALRTNPAALEVVDIQTRW
ncbi:hypothetical protein ASD62_04990 [Phycicoccus sp. Root563]|nr:hypothetical protein ASD62_04990 [Phycicoccus sp. Root563]